VHIDKVKTRDFLKVIWSDPIKKRATIFGWISNAAQGAEFTAWGFYLPYILVVAGVGVAANASLIGTNIVTAGIFLLATLSGWVAPLMLKRIGHKGVSMWGFGLAFLGLMLGALSLWQIDVLSRGRPQPWRVAGAAGRRSLHPHVGALLGCFERHDHHLDGRPGEVQGHGVRVRLHVRQGCGILRRLRVPSDERELGQGRSHPSRWASSR